ncbi:MAG: branched-chain amino acid ABC transporter permease [Thermodesulfobacteriota bacterium]|jgi:branched-chain amino acid transport system permease protein
MDTNILVQAIISGLLMGGIYALVAVSLNLIFGVMKIINFAHGAFMMLGMYVTYWVSVFLDIHPYLSLLLSMSVLFVVGFLIQYGLINRIIEAPEYNQLLLTLGVALFLENLALFLWTPNYRMIKVTTFAGAVHVGKVMFSTPRMIAFGAALTMTLLLYLFLTKTDSGKAIRAISQDREGAHVIGINLKMIYSLAFGIGSACVAAAGTMITPFFYITPTVGLVFVITAFVIVVLGGLGSFWGAFFGALIVGVAESLGEVLLSGSLKQVPIYSIFILTLLFRPKGLFGKRHV